MNILLNENQLRLLSEETAGIDFFLDYLIEKDFKQANIEVIYQDYNYPTYPQLWGDFLPYMSILDFWMNTDDYALIFKGEHNERTSSKNSGIFASMG